MVVPVKEVIVDTPPVILDAIERFTCKDEDVETFLKKKSFDFERRNKSRTYLVFDDMGVLLAYFTLALDALLFGDDVSKNTIKKIDGFSKDIQAVGIIMIGQFGKDSNLAKNVSGAQLLETCLETVYQIQSLVGGRAVMLECHDISKVVEFYKSNGFAVLQYDERDNYLQMVRLL